MSLRIVIIALALALGALGALGQSSLAQEAEETPQATTPDMAGSRYAIDHIFFFADAFAPEMSYAEQRGFRRWPFNNTHTGQGTTGRYMRFDNVYLEFLWIDDAEVAANNIESVNSDFNARNRWREDPSVSPFGIGLRDLREDGGEPHPFEVSTYTSEWMRGNFELYPAENAPDVSEPWVFFLPLEITGNARDEFTGAAAETLNHPHGGRIVTAVTIVLPHGQQPSRTLQALVDDGLVSIIHGDEHRMEIELDNGVQGETIDMRDRGMPFIFHL